MELMELVVVELVVLLMDFQELSGLKLDLKAFYFGVGENLLPEH